MISKRIKQVLQNKTGIILIDLSWMLHRNYHTFAWMSVEINGYDRPTGHIYGVLYTIENLRQKYPDYAIVLCQDGIPVSRQELSGSNDVGYKAGRSEIEFDFYKDIPIIEAAGYLSPNVYWAFNSDKESDDIMFALAKQAEQVSDCDVLIYSGDNDLLQAIDDRISVVRKIGTNGMLDKITSDVVRSSEEFTKKFHGVDPAHIIYYRCIVGDSSDNLRGIPRFPRKLASEIAMSATSFESLFSFSPMTKTEAKYIQLLNDNRATIEFNYKMMVLSDNIDVNLFRKRPDVDKVVKSLRELKLSRYLKFLGVEEDV